MNSEDDEVRLVPSKKGFRPMFDLLCQKTEERAAKLVSGANPSQVVASTWFGELSKYENPILSYAHPRAHGSSEADRNIMQCLVV